MSEKRESFVKLLHKIFELDKSDLDFGIYRIMNIRKEQIKDFLDKKLPEQIKAILEQVAIENRDQIHKKMKELERQTTQFSMVAENTVEYIYSKEQDTSLTDIIALETDVYSNLYNFFNRYYDEGDFISKRRYKEGVYAIPYEGEEVKLCWANQDQYYIKTTENFKDYSFKFKDITIHFILIDATTEQNNNKENENKRVFMLFKENDEQPNIKTFEKRDNELIIRFVYNISKENQKERNNRDNTTIENYVKKNIPKLVSLTIQSEESTDGKKISLIQKHLNRYVAKNTFDYFIHKDLGGFLNRELDFFIKNEIVHLDEIDNGNTEQIYRYLAKVRAVKETGKIIINFLAQIENFQKRLWLKKKFVLRTDWCITLDKVPEELYEEIRNNKEQVNEWIELYAIDEAINNNDLELTEKWTNPPSVEFLKINKNLLIDTKHFNPLFKDKLISSIENLDEETNGVLIHSENFQALNLLSSRYMGQVRCIYIDPPYNTDASKILYKNGYEHSSWISLMESRLKLAWHFLSSDGILEVAIDDYEYRYLNLLLDNIFGLNNIISNIAILTNPKGRDQGFIAQAHDYTIMYAKNKSLAETNNFILGDDEIKKKFSKSKGELTLRELPLKRTGSGKSREERPYMFYPFIYDSKNDKLSVVSEDEYKKIYNQKTNIFDDDFLSVLIKQYEKKGYIVILPIDNRNEYLRWRWGYKKAEKGCENGILFAKKLREGTHSVYQNDFADNEVTPKSLWISERYDASSKGTNLLENIIPKNPFDYPKSLYTVEDNILIGSNENDTILDFFAGSGTTGHAIIDLNRINNYSNRHYILVEMGEYFNKVTKPRIQKVVYAKDWKEGKPTSRQTGISQIIKYFRLESYEDTLINIDFSDSPNGKSLEFGNDYLINYMLDVETKGSLLNIEKFKEPFDYYLKITEKNEVKEINIDLVETFNYLIGLNVVHQDTLRSFKAISNNDKDYAGSVDLKEDANGNYSFKQLEGTLNDGSRILVIWRNTSDNIISSNTALDAYFQKNRKKNGLFWEYSGKQGKMINLEDGNHRFNLPIL